MDHASFFSEATLIAHLHDDVMHALHACSQEKNKMVAHSGGGFTCCVPGCFTNSKRDTHLSFYVFPKEKNLRRRWLHSISRKNFKATTGHRVCSLHFKGGKKTYINTRAIYTRKNKTRTVPFIRACLI